MDNECVGVVFEAPKSHSAPILQSLGHLVGMDFVPIWRMFSFKSAQTPMIFLGQSSAFRDFGRVRSDYHSSLVANQSIWALLLLLRISLMGSTAVIPAFQEYCHATGCGVLLVESL